MEHAAKNDKWLLARYAAEGSQAAFSALVTRHIKLVYSTCYRELRQRELAEEATQAVFITLAHKAGSVPSGAELAAWLYTTAWFKASALGEKERLRMIREGQAADEAQRIYERSDDEAWGLIEPALNDCISALPAIDRQAILLRFFEEKSLREVGVELGTSEEAARKRVSRALEKLREALVDRRAAVVSVAALAALLSARATYAVPAHLSPLVSQSAGAIASPSLPPPVSGGRVPASGCVSRGGFPLNPLLAKGLLIVSTTKIFAGGAAALVLILALTFVVVHHAHSAAQPGTPQSGPPAGSGSSAGSSLIWQAPPASDPATQQVQQQIKAEMDIFAHGLSTGNVQEATALFPPGYSYRAMQTDTDKGFFPRGSPGVKGGRWYPGEFYSWWFSSGWRSEQLVVTSCTITGDWAQVAVLNNAAVFHGRRRHGRTSPLPMVYTLIKTGDKWLMPPPAMRVPHNLQLRGQSLLSSLLSRSFKQTVQAFVDKGFTLIELRSDCNHRYIGPCFPRAGKARGKPRQNKSL